MEPVHPGTHCCRAAEGGDELAVGEHVDLPHPNEGGHDIWPEIDSLANAGATSRFVVKESVFAPFLQNKRFPLRLRAIGCRTKRYCGLCRRFGRA